MIQLTLAPLGQLTLVKGWNLLPGTSFGAHLYQRDFPNSISVCGLRCSNGAVNKDGSGFMGKFYFDSLKLSLPMGYVFVAEAIRLGEINSGGVYAICQGSNHVFLPRWILERRFAICPAGHEQEALRLLHASDLHIPDPVTNYGPMDSQQPHVDRAGYQTRFTGFLPSVKQALAQGHTLYIEDRWDTRGAFGPWQPEGQPDAGPGDPGGYKVNPCHGFEQCNAAIQFGKLSLGCIMDREPVAAYDRVSGKPISLYDWTTPPDRQAMANGQNELGCFLTGSWGNRVYRQLNSGFSPYEAALAAYRPRDNAHLIRYMEEAIPVIEYTQDKMVLDDFVMVMENARYGTWSDRQDQQTTQAYPGQYIPPSLSFALTAATAHPHDGGGVDRAFGWTMYGGAFMVKRGAAGWNTWGHNMLTLSALLADKFGFVMNDTSHPEFFQPGYSGIQKFHEDIITIGRLALAKQLGASGPESVLSAKTLYINGQVFPYKYNAAEFGAMHWIATRGPGVLPMPDNTSLEGGDVAHALAVLSALYEFTLDKRYLDVSLKHWLPHPDLATRKAWLQSQDDLGWGGTMLATLQKVVP